MNHYGSFTFDKVTIEMYVDNSGWLQLIAKDVATILGVSTKQLLKMTSPEKTTLNAPITFTRSAALINKDAVISVCNKICLAKAMEFKTWLLTFKDPILQYNDDLLNHRVVKVKGNDIPMPTGSSSMINAASIPMGCAPMPGYYPTFMGYPSMPIGPRIGGMDYQIQSPVPQVGSLKMLPIPESMKLQYCYSRKELSEFTIDVVIKDLNDIGIQITREQLCQWLLDEGIFCKDREGIYHVQHSAVENNLFRDILTVDSDGNFAYIIVCTLVGRDFIRDHIDNLRMAIDVKEKANKTKSDTADEDNQLPSELFDLFGKAAMAESKEEFAKYFRKLFCAGSGVSQLMDSSKGMKQKRC